MTDWATISSLATAAGTTALAAATFAFTRSSNKAARTAERALDAGLRPVLFPSRPHDDDQTIRWGDDHWAELAGASGTVEHLDDVVYLAMSLRNVGAGIAVLHGWRFSEMRVAAGTPHPAVDEFRLQERDLYVPAGDTSFWQAAIRRPDDPDRAAAVAAVEERTMIAVDLLYGDHEGGQRTISRFALNPRGDGTWMCAVARHWNLDRADPR